MRNLTPYGIFISSFIVGLFLAIQIQTGININPDYLIINVTDKIVQQINVPQTFSMWEEMKLLITIIVIISLLVDIFLIVSFGLIGIISAVFWIFSRIINNSKHTNWSNLFNTWSDYLYNNHSIIKLRVLRTLRSLLLTSGLSAMPNSEHTTTLRSAQIRKQTSYVRKTLGGIAKQNRR
jgi:hypothetical protein